jgi:transcriptional regulator with XRE-family HTH domain
MENIDSNSTKIQEMRNILKQVISEHVRKKADLESVRYTDEFAYHERLRAVAILSSINARLIAQDKDFMESLIDLSDEERKNKILNYQFSEEQQDQIDSRLESERRLIELQRLENDNQIELRARLSENLGELLKEHSLSQRQLVLALRKKYYVTISPSQFSKMFSPNNAMFQEPGLYLLHSMAQFFNVTIDRIVNGKDSNSNLQEPSDYCDLSILTYSKFLRLLNMLEQNGFISFERHEDRPLSTTGDAGDVDVTIHIHPKQNNSGGDDGTIAHYLSMYTSLKKHFPDTPEGRRMVDEMNDMMLKAVSDAPLFSDEQ